MGRKSAPPSNQQCYSMPKRGQRELSKSTCTLTNYAVLHTQKKTEEIRVNIAP